MSSECKETLNTRYLHTYFLLSVHHRSAEKSVIRNREYLRSISAARAACSWTYVVFKTMLNVSVFPTLLHRKRQPGGVVYQYNRRRRFYMPSQETNNISIRHSKTPASRRYKVLRDQHYSRAIYRHPYAYTYAKMLKFRNPTQLPTSVHAKNYIREEVHNTTWKYIQ
jgi:hypothetical protein